MRRAAFAAVAAVLASCGQPPAEAPSAPAASSAPAAAPAPKPAAAVVTPEIQAAIASLPAPYNAGDYVNGRRVYANCRSCHVTEEGGGNRVGPNLHGMFGRAAGAVPDFAYSPALKTAGITWDGATLDQWLANPRTFLPGNRMSFAGVRDAEDRRDLIAYLKVETSQ